MSSSEKKKKRKTKQKPSPVSSPTPQSTLIPSLPTDLLLSCFARVSRLYYPTLSLVSKSFRSLLASPELHQTQSSLGRNESCLYVCLRFQHDPVPRWYTLCRKPNQTQTSKKKSNLYALAKIPIPNTPQAYIEEAVVALGSSIYILGGSTCKMPSATVHMLDCRSNMWSEAPSLLVEREIPIANVLDGKIYVVGGYKDATSSNWMEVFDPKTQAWEPVVCSLPDRCSNVLYRSAVIDGELYWFGDKSVCYRPKDERWEAIEGHYLGLGWRGVSYCSIGNIVYCYTRQDGMKWYNSNISCWVSLEGLKDLPKFAGYALVRLLDYGGKLLVLWDKNCRSSGYRNKRIWCAVIALERRGSHEIWGNVEWIEDVLTVPESYQFVCAVAVTL